MVKSSEDFQSFYKQGDYTSRKLSNFLKENGFDVEDFDINEDFRKCDENCPNMVEHMGKKIPLARWLLFQQISRPDFIIKKTRPILIEVKHKNKKFLWVNKRDYPHYIRWASILEIPLIILMFIQGNGWYAHKLVKENKLPSYKAKDGNEVYVLDNFSDKLENNNQLLKYLEGIK